MRMNLLSVPSLHADEIYAEIYSSHILTLSSTRNTYMQRLAMLAAAGWPLSELFDKKRRWVATVRADGSLAIGKQTGSIHGLGKELQGAPSCNGWTFWHYDADGEIKPIDAARQLYLLASED